MNSLWMTWLANDHTQSWPLDPNLSNSRVQGFKYFSIEEEEEEDNTGKLEHRGCENEGAEDEARKTVGQIIKTPEVLEK